MLWHAPHIQFSKKMFVKCWHLLLLYLCDVACEWGACCHSTQKWPEFAADAENHADWISLGHHFKGGRWTHKTWEASFVRLSRTWTKEKPVFYIVIRPGHLSTRQIKYQNHDRFRVTRQNGVIFQFLKTCDWTLWPFLTISKVSSGSTERALIASRHAWFQVLKCPFFDQLY